MASSSKFTKPKTLEDIFKDYSARRAAIIRALTDDADELYSRCDPAKDAFCLFGHPNGLWEVAEPSEFVPPELPEPVLGINYVRDDLSRTDWLSLIAVHSDCWLLSVASFLGGYLLLNRKERKRLFNMINELPTIYEVYTRSKQDNPTIDSSSKCRSSSKRSHDARTRTNSKLLEESDDEEPCGDCGKTYILDEFWIYCDVCKKWFHGDCVKITLAEAQSIGKYECPSCKTKRGMQ